MTVIKAVRAEPGGRVVLSFTVDGYAADGESWSDRLERWGARLFGTKKLFIALGLAILTSLPAWAAIRILGESDAVILATTTVPLLLLLYFLVGMLLHAAVGAVAYVMAFVTLPFLLIPSYRGWLLPKKPPVRERPGFVHAGWIGQAWAVRDGTRTAVSLHFTNGTQIRYTADGAAGRDLVARFQRLLGARMITH
ncbi:hypothetical protein Acsp04_01490 [Actinomadura sp. NBRC 104425]|uniref:hypothetical protein n=1 Tax=Actinomadura sp. NBRC 104425 TaxID=3032204 RepID=UPI0024A053FD|nr:hypothetical protein [Actinomadura sp. NBRC 104425]GLZ09914.1 hypothetical protein Acsp04_01490 [Actinomadura sp. NBRC 104425]